MAGGDRMRGHEAVGGDTGWVAVAFWGSHAMGRVLCWGIWGERGTSPQLSPLVSTHPGLRLGLCRERPPRLGGPGGAPGGSGAGPPRRRRAGAGAALHPPPLPLAAGGRSLRRPPGPPKSAGVSDLALYRQPRDPHPNKTAPGAAAAVRSLFFGGGLALEWGRYFGGAPPPHVPGRPGPPPSLGAAAPKSLRSLAGGPERRSPRGIREGVPGVRRGRAGVRREGGGGSGRPAAPSGFLGPLPARCHFRFRRRLRRGPRGPGGGSRGWLLAGSRAPPLARHRHGLAPTRLCSGKWGSPRPWQFDPRPSGTPARAPWDAQRPPGAPQVSLLLVLAVPAPSSCCSFDFNPVSSTFSAHLNNLVRPPPPGAPPAPPATPPPDLRDPLGTSRISPETQRIPLCPSQPQNSLIPQGRPHPASPKPPDCTRSPPKGCWGPPERPPQPSGLFLGTP